MKKLLTLIAAACMINSAEAQLKTPAPSPLQTVTQAFGLGEIKIEYSRPSTKGRKIYGDLVAFGKMWRTGANQSTKITFADDIKVNGTDVKAGTYALYTIPNMGEWDMMLYKDLTLGGSTDEYKMENELMRFKAKAQDTKDFTETFTITVNNITSTSCSIDLVWANTKVSIPVTTVIDDKVMKNIEKEMANDKRPYFSAANYYFENGKDLNKAAEWINKAVEINPNAYWIWHVKAKINAKQGNKAEAMKAAETSMEKAKEDKNDDYVKMNEKIIAEIKAMK
ncbi:MAG TPA: DUF2911 domain-containing protein [Bacteroidia bacterium]|nr:DUF2911 domain-containing protein [Bacteroidia bacterium]HNU34576.1 DUF2911 domain-containing protein [Bacteroidia bacterium]